MYTTHAHTWFMPLNIWEDSEWWSLDSSLLGSYPSSSTSCWALGSLFNHSVPQSPFFKMGNINASNFMRLLEGLNSSINVNIMMVTDTWEINLWKFCHILITMRFILSFLRLGCYTGMLEDGQVFSNSRRGVIFDSEYTRNWESDKSRGNWE